MKNFPFFLLFTAFFILSVGTFDDYLLWFNEIHCNKKRNLLFDKYVVVELSALCIQFKKENGTQSQSSHTNCNILITEFGSSFQTHRNEENETYVQLILQ